MSKLFTLFVVCRKRIVANSFPFYLHKSKEVCTFANGLNLLLTITYYYYEKIYSSKIIPSAMRPLSRSRNGVGG